MAAASYEESPPDEGYSEDPLTLGASANLPPWLSTMTATEQTGTSFSKLTVNKNRN